MTVVPGTSVRGEGMKKVWGAVRKDLWIVILDIIAVNAAYLLALLIRFFVNGAFRPIVTNTYLPAFWQFAPYYTVLSIVIFIAFRLYGGMWTYAGLNDMNRIIAANVCTAAVQIIGTCLFVRRMPITYYVIGAALQFLFVATIRFGYRILMVEKRKIGSRSKATIPTVVIGSGETARRAVHHLEGSPFRVTAIVDAKSAGKSLDGIPVVAEPDLKSVRAVFIADPGLSADEKKAIRRQCEEAGVEVQDYTGFFKNLGGRVPVTSVLELVDGPVTLVVDGEAKEYASGEQAVASLTERYDIRSIQGARVTLEKPAADSAFAGYETWAEEHRKKTGEDVSFF